MAESKPAFDPNKPFQAADATAKPAFDPNKPFQAAAPNDSRYSDAMNSLYDTREDAALGPRQPLVSGQTALNMLPVAGSIGGGIIGGAAGLASPVPGGAMIGEYAGAGAGGAAGEAAKYAGEKYLLGKDMTNENLGKRMLVSGAAGVIGQGVGNAVNAAGRSFANSGIQDVAGSLAKPGSEEIANAATQLKVKPTQGMMTDDYTVRNLEDSLGQSPSIPGSMIRSEQRPVREAIQGAAENSVADASAQSDYDAGRQLKKGISENFQKRLDPIQEAYGDIENKTKDIPIDEKGIKRIANNIRNLDDAKFSGSDGHSVANRFANWLEEAENVNHIKTLKTKARYITEDSNASREEKVIASSIMDKLEQARNNTVTRQAVQKAREAPVFPDKGAFPSKQAARDAMSMAESDAEDSAKGLISKIKDTNSQYRGLMTDAKTFGEGTGLTKAKSGKGLSSMLQDIQGATPEETSKALFDPNNVDFMNFVKEKMPKEFELARQQKLAEIVKKTGGDPNKIIKLAEKLGPEAKQILFGSENVQNLGAAGTLLKAIPGKVGASDTPRGLDFHDLGLMQNARDLGRYGLLKGKEQFPKAGMLMQKARYPVQGLVNKGLIDERQD